jgi:predicted protein tyrosine phosphatase
MNLLFLCARNRLRSPTAEIIFGKVAGIETRSAGVNQDANQVVSGDDIEWADLILVMERIHSVRLNRSHAKLLRGKRIVCLGIRDDFEFMDEELVKLLWERVPPSVPALLAAKPRRE